jgi:hypothetical protein
MDLQSNAADGGGDGIVTIESPARTPEQVSLREAGRILARHRNRGGGDDRGAAGPDEAPVSASAAEPLDAWSDGPADELTDEVDAAPPNEARSETQADDPSSFEAPIDPPRSWTKEHKEAFAALPRDIQERVSEVERARETDFLRRQQDAAEQRKAAEAEREQLAHAKLQYEAALPALLQSMQAQVAEEFADIQNMADVERMAREDFPRYALWYAQQKKLAAVAQELHAVQHRQAHELQARWAHFAQREDELMNEQVPELLDPDKAPKLRESALGVLRDRGFTDGELSALYNGQAGLSLRDHRIQLLILDAVRWREAQAKARQAEARPVPPVQRPGVAQGRAGASDADIQALRQKLERSGSIRDAAALRAAQLKAARRG